LLYKTEKLGTRGLPRKLIEYVEQSAWVQVTEQPDRLSTNAKVITRLTHTIQPID